MSSRRPNKPRAGSGAPKSRASVAGQHDGGASRPGSSQPRGGASGPSPVRGAQAKPGAGKERIGTSGPAKPNAATSAAAKPSAKVLRLPKPEARLKQRAELSAAIRSGRPGAASNAPAPSPEVAHEPVPARSFSGRLVALALVLAGVIAFLLPSAGVYLDQRKELNALRDTIASLEAEQEYLETQIERWEDPAYIRQQARERINLVMPGERKYMVIGEPAETEETPLPENASASAVRTDLPWVDALWDSVRRAATD